MHFSLENKRRSLSRNESQFRLMSLIVLGLLGLILLKEFGSRHPNAETITVASEPQVVIAASPTSDEIAAVAEVEKINASRATLFTAGEGTESTSPQAR